MSAESLAVSVIVSNLNGARYLTRLLDTVIAQDGVETELIVVDRHSTDESAWGVLSPQPLAYLLSISVQDA